MNDADEDHLEQNCLLQEFNKSFFIVAILVITDLILLLRVSSRNEKKEK